MLFKSKCLSTYYGAVEQGLSCVNQRDLVFPRGDTHFNIPPVGTQDVFLSGQTEKQLFVPTKQLK